MALKNLIRTEVSRLGRSSWRLTTHDGLPIHAFDIFCDRNADYSPRTQKRYAESVSRFLDYLFEAGAFGHGAITRKYLNDVVEAYLPLLRNGSAETVAWIEGQLPGSSTDLWLAQAAEALRWRPLRPASFANTVASLNRFLELCEALGAEAYERARMLGIDHQQSHERLFQGLGALAAISQAEVTQLRQNSLLGGLAKFASVGLRRPRRLRVARVATQGDRTRLDFPLRHVSALIDAATSWRDKALWLLLAASGIRTSEARNLLFDDVDFDEQQIYIVDPSGRRYELSGTLIRQPRFKGRAMASTYLFPPLRQLFFQALDHYLRQEYVPCSRPGEARHLFQYVEANRRGRPLVNASDTAMAKSFKLAVRRAGLSPPPNRREWTPHSLRHLYGVYMLNSYPLDPEQGKFGLSLVEVQMLMGHANIRSTQHYARAKQDRLVTRLKQSDEALLALDPEKKKLLPLGVIQRVGTVR